jgi:vitamin B12 transporter
MTRHHLRSGAACSALLAATLWIAPAGAQQPSPLVQKPSPPAPQPVSPADPAQAPIADPQQFPTTPTNLKLPEVVVTATGYPTPVTKIAGTVQVIDQDAIARSTAKSVSGLLAENAVGFMSEWSPGQTSINIRGAATEGQGRDFKSEVLVLINGHRAGTSNVSKLSIADVERIEIVRGPSSVVYGSQNMGGVINIIMKTGKTAPGSFVEAAAGSWGFLEGKLQNGGSYKNVDWYLGLAGGKQNNYQVGGGSVQQNTAWTRGGGTASLGYQIDDNQRVDMTARSDGIYDAGFVGSSANIFAYDTRFNRSFDMSYNGKTNDGRGNVFFQTYYVQDVDDLNNPSPLSNLNAPASRTTVDHNRRQLDIVGTRFQPRYKIGFGNEMLVGLDWERSWMNSNRNREGLRPVVQLSPQDNNEANTSYAFYAEDTQNLFDDRVTLRAGIRQTMGSTTLETTPWAPTLIPGTVNYQASTYSLGVTARAADWLNLRAGASSGFRAPTATELGANFTTTPIGTTIFGNPHLSPETSHQLELGGTLTSSTARFDAVVFQNIISNRIAPMTTSAIGGVVIQTQQNNPADIVVQGVEFQADADVIKSLHIPATPDWRWNFYGNGYYNFKMVDYGASGAAQAFQATRINQYEAAIGTRFGQAGISIPWNINVLGVLRGPMWYNTEESLSPIFFPGQIRNTTVYQKGAFWVWNTRAEVEVRPGVNFFMYVNNIFDVNQSPVFIATNQYTCTANLANQNGGCGNSMAGREIVAGVQIRW